MISYFTLPYVMAAIQQILKFKQIPYKIKTGVLIQLFPSARWRVDFLDEMLMLLQNLKLFKAPGSEVI